MSSRACCKRKKEKSREKSKSINCLTGGIFFRREKKWRFERKRKKKPTQKTKTHRLKRTHTYTHTKAFKSNHKNQYGRILGRTQTQRHLARLVDRAHSRVHVHFRRVSNTATLKNDTNLEQNHGRCYDECDDETRERKRKEWVSCWEKSAGKNGEVELRDRRGVVLQGKRKGKKKQR